MMIKTRLLKSLPALALLVPIAALANPCSNTSFSNMYVIGDSLSDQGNLFQATTSLTGYGSPAEDHYFMGRFSNGKAYTDMLAEKLRICLTASSLGGTNFAYGGTRTNYNIVENPPTEGGFTPGLLPWTLNLQRQAFTDQTINDPHAFYIVFSGSNDISDLIGSTIAQGFEATKPFSDQAVQGIRESIQAFINAGARDILVPNLPDLGIVPRVVQGNPPNSTLVSETATALTTRYNQALNQMLDEVANDNNVNIIRFDTFSFLREVVGNPTAFGLSNSTEPCYTGYVAPASPTDTVCDTPDSYVFWDNEHPTTAFHAIMASKIEFTLISNLLQDLRKQVVDMDLQKGIERALLVKLTIAKRYHEDGRKNNDNAIPIVLHGFINEIKALRGRKIPRAEANALIERTQQIKQIIQYVND
ncbi:Lipase 1 [Methylococcales bacterium]|nr:Lipase 1 [Methylococcales bacterium]